MRHFDRIPIYSRNAGYINDGDNNVSYFVSGKPRGLRTARKHVNHRRDQRWADKDYKKAHLGTRWKANPFGGASHAKGIVLEKV